MKKKIALKGLFICLACWLTACTKTATERENTSPPLSKNTENARESLPHTKQFSAEVATSWYDLLTSLTKNTPYVPPPTVRIFAYAGLTLYEAVLPGMPSYQSMYRQMTGNEISAGPKKDYYWPAVANAAMARITTKMTKVYTPVTNPAILQLENSFNLQFQSLITTEQFEASVNFGRSVADIIYEWSKTDGTLSATGTLAPCPPYILLGGAGNWVPTPPGFFVAAGACQGNLRTFIPNVVITTRPPTHPPYSTDPTSTFYAAAWDIYQKTLHATPAEKLIGEAWRDRLGVNYNTPSHIVKLTSKFITASAMNLEDASVLYAKEGIAMFDAVASTFNSKFHYSLLRPVTYIRNVIGITGWNSQYPAPQHPAYPAVAPSAAAAAIEILESVFGEEFTFTDDTQEALYGAWHYSSLNEMLLDVGKSRTHTGLNFQFAVSEGISQGREVGTLVNNLPFRKP